MAALNYDLQQVLWDAVWVETPFLLVVGVLAVDDSQSIPSLGVVQLKRATSPSRDSPHPEVYKGLPSSS